MGGATKLIADATPEASRDVISSGNRPEWKPSLLNSSVCLPMATSTIFGVVPTSLPSTFSDAPCGTEFAVMAMDVVREVCVHGQGNGVSRCRKRGLELHGLAGTDVGEVNRALADAGFALVEDIEGEIRTSDGLGREVLGASFSEVRALLAHSANFLKLGKGEVQRRLSGLRPG